MNKPIFPNWRNSEDESPPIDTCLYIRGYFGLKMWDKLLGDSIGILKRKGEYLREYEWHVEEHDQPYWSGYLEVTEWAFVEEQP